MEKFNLNIIKKYLAEYKGPKLQIMEICGSHTSAIGRFGIKSLLSPQIHLVSGPGCPVCVTPTSYLDRLIALSNQPQTCVVTFGDLLRVPGSVQSLNEAKGQGARVEMVYSPADILTLAQKSPEEQFVFAAVGFETTTPVYALLLEQLEQKEITNVRLLTALKTMPAAVDYLLKNGANVDGFLAPGHVCAVTGSQIFLPAAQTYKVPFVVAGFEGEELLLALYSLVRMCAGHQVGVVNDYTSVVSNQGNLIAQNKVNHYFEPCDAAWRGMGIIPESGRRLRDQFSKYDAGSNDLIEDHKRNKACCCDQILMGRMEPEQCSLYGKICTPLTPQGACMVSEEGSCRQSLQYGNDIMNN